MRNIPSLALLFLGLLVMAVSFMYYAGNALPYPDPTAELLAHQAGRQKMEPALRAWVARNYDWWSLSLEAIKGQELRAGSAD
jgi:hypothetical protein